MPGDRAQPRAHAEQAGRLAIHQFHAVGFGDVDPADALELQQLAFHHHLGQADQQVQDLEIALAQRDLEGLHVQPVARQHAGVIAPLDVGGGTSAARLRRIDHVVVHQRRGVDHLHHRAQLDRRRAAAVADQFGRDQQQRRPQPFAAADCRYWPMAVTALHRGDRFRG